eukprot:scaffold11310_cov84-Cylindrotheca_fusiformis.AAC.1
MTSKRDDIHSGNTSRTDLDSHANMFVAGRDAFVLATTGRDASVKAFDPSMAPVDLPIVDCAIKYACPFSDSTFILVVRNALHVPTMDHNLVPPFLMREAGLEVNETPKMQLKEPTEMDHSIYFPSVNLRIPLSLWAIFSFFPTSKPTELELRTEEIDVLALTPEGPWNPQSDVYSRNEENMLDWEGQIIEPCARVRFVLDDVPSDDAMVQSLQVSSAETAFLDSAFESRPSVSECDAGETQLPPECDDDALLHGINPILAPSSLAQALHERAHLGNYCASVGATTALKGNVLLPEQDDDLEAVLAGQIDLDEFFVSSATATSTRGVDASHLAKVWRIDLNTAQSTIDTTSQRCVRPNSNALNRNYSTNDRMLRYKRIHSHLFMDTLLATK